MLAYILACAIGLSSLILFIMAFSAPAIHKKDDFLWSGVGLFYALVLWLCAGRITGAVLLGQTAVTILVISFGWQTLKLRRAIAYPDSQTGVEEFSVMGWIQSLLGGGGKKKIAPTAPKAEEKETQEPITPESVTPSPETPVTQTTSEDKKEETPPAAEEETTVELEEAVTQEQTTPTPATVEKEEKSPENKQKKEQKSGFSLKNLFSFGKRQPKYEPAKVAKALQDSKPETGLDETDKEWETLAQPTEQSPPSVESTVSAQETPTIITPEEIPAATTPSILEDEVESAPLETTSKGEKATADVSDMQSVGESKSQIEAFIPDDEMETEIESKRSRSVEYLPKSEKDKEKEQEIIPSRSDFAPDTQENISLTTDKETDSKTVEITPSTENKDN